MCPLNEFLKKSISNLFIGALLERLPSALKSDNGKVSLVRVLVDEVADADVEHQAQRHTANDAKLRKELTFRAEQQEGRAHGQRSKRNRLEKRRS